MEFEMPLRRASRLQLLTRASLEPRQRYDARIARGQGRPTHPDKPHGRVASHCSHNGFDPILEFGESNLIHTLHVGFMEAA